MSVEVKAAKETRNMYEGDSGWTRKGATLSDKTARKDFGLTQQEIVEAIREGKLQFRENHIHGNPYRRLLRHFTSARTGNAPGTG